MANIKSNIKRIGTNEKARQRNIAVTTVHREQTDGYQTLIRLTVSTERGERSVAGTLFHEQRPHLVEIRGIEVEAQLGPHMLYVRNDDRPGVIGKVGTVLGDAGVNIADMGVGQSPAGESALMVIATSQPVSSDVVDALLAADGVTSVHASRTS